MKLFDVVDARDTELIELLQLILDPATIACSAFESVFDFGAKLFIWQAPQLRHGLLANALPIGRLLRNSFQ